ncbi:MAG: hypothetical protein K2M95_06620 [Clostridiales bacterium]|nr:hypothetical protein [Clostridiales bacterium]
MRKEKFNKKEQECKEYEEKVLAEFKEFLKPYNSELVGQGVEINCYLSWYYPDQKEDEEESWDIRKPVQPKKTYFCDLVVWVGYIGKFADWLADKCDADCLVCNKFVSYYGGIARFMFKKIWGFRKFRDKWLRKEVEKLVRKIKEVGFEETMASIHVSKRMRKRMEKIENELAQEDAQANQNNEQAENLSSNNE